MSDGNDNEDPEGRPFSPAERAQFRKEHAEMREILDNYKHSRAFFSFALVLAKYVAAIIAAVVAWQTFPKVLK